MSEVVVTSQKNLQHEVRYGVGQAFITDEPRAAGRHTLVWDGTDRTGSAVASGVYWARLDAEDASRSMRMVLLRR